MANEGESSVGFGFSQKDSKTHYNNAMSGADSSQNTSFSAASNKTKSEKAEAKKTSDIFTMTAAQIAQTFTQITEELVVMKSSAAQMDAALTTLASTAQNLIASINEQNGKVATELSEHYKILASMKAGTHPLAMAYGDDSAMLTTQIELKDAEINSAKVSSKILLSTIETTTEKYDAAQGSKIDAQATLDRLEVLTDNFDHTPEQLEALQVLEDAANEQAKAAELSIKEVEQKLQQATAIAKLANDLEGISRTCGTIEHEQAKIEQINSITAIKESLHDVLADGQISQAEMPAITEQVKAAELRGGIKTDFINDLANAGIKIEGANGEILTGTDAAAIMIEQWHQDAPPISSIIEGETLTLDVPKYSLEEQEAAYNNAMNLIDAAVANDSPLSQEDYDMLAESPIGNQLDDILAGNNVTVGAPNVATDYSFTPTSFADSIHFRETHPTTGAMPEYARITDNHAPSMSLTSNVFGKDADKLAEEQALEEELRLELEQRSAPTSPTNMA